MENEEKKERREKQSKEKFIKCVLGAKVRRALGAKSKFRGPKTPSPENSEGKETSALGASSEGKSWLKCIRVQKVLREKDTSV